MIRIEGKRQALKNLPPHVMSSIGINQIAYITTQFDEDQLTHTVHAADGSQIMVTDDLEEARDTIRTHNLHQVTVH